MFICEGQRGLLPTAGACLSQDLETRVCITGGHARNSNNTSKMKLRSSSQNLITLIEWPSAGTVASLWTLFLLIIL